MKHQGFFIYFKIFFTIRSSALYTTTPKVHCFGQLLFYGTYFAYKAVSAEPRALQSRIPSWACSASSRSIFASASATDFGLFNALVCPYGIRTTFTLRGGRLFHVFCNADVAFSATQFPLLPVQEFINTTQMLCHPLVAKLIHLIPPVRQGIRGRATPGSPFHQIAQGVFQYILSRCPNKKKMVRGLIEYQQINRLQQRRIMASRASSPRQYLHFLSTLAFQT